MAPPVYQPLRPKTQPLSCHFCGLFVSTLTLGSFYPALNPDTRDPFVTHHLWCLFLFQISLWLPCKHLMNVNY